MQFICVNMIVCNNYKRAETREIVLMYSVTGAVLRGRMAPTYKIVEVIVLIQQTYCDQCNKSFKIKLKTKSHGINIKETYFICPHCKARYTAYVLDGECRKLQSEIRKLQRSKNLPGQAFAKNQIDEGEYKKAIDDIENEIEKVQTVLKIKMDQLKEALT